ncbi:MAG: hypothetical protein JSV89_05775 [Spirochaetaceae bacterium]|nr:MAG: hypothetical protein JSV89_05775 [Spirochaetaceae bacterium]
MRLREVSETLDLRIRSAAKQMDTEVRGGYASDLMSDVMAHAEQGDLWVTLQIHVNIVAVAAMKELAGIVLVNGREPEADTVMKAEEKGVPILVSELPAFELIGRLYELGIPGQQADAEGA